MNNNPYSDFDEQRISGATAKRKSISSVFLVLGIIGILLCGGLGTLVYFGYQQASPRPPVTMNQGSSSFDACLADLNRGFDQLVVDSNSPPDHSEQTVAVTRDNPVEAEVRQFMTTHVNALSIGDTVPFNDAQFIEAVSNSSLLTTPLSLMQRIQLKAWIAAAPPLPWAGGEMKIVGIRVPQSKLATVDFLLHIGHPEAETFRWHLVKVDGAWQLYDWRALDFGQSMSDEYAGYMVDQTSVAEGYDRINELIDEADTAFEYEDDEEKARRILRTAEQTPVLDSDRPDATLRIAYAWRAMEEYEEAIRVAKLVPSPNQRLGVWPLLCACYLELKDFDQAIEAANALAELSPHHPNVHLLKSEIWWAQDDVEKTVMAAIPALQVVPEDASTWWDVISLSKPEFLVEQSPTWIPWLVRGKQTTPMLDLIEAATLADDPSACLQALDAAYVPSGWNYIARGNLADGDAKNDEAVDWFLKAEQESTEEALVDYAGDRRHEIRLLADEYEQLLSDGNDVDANLKRLLTTAYDYELECDHRRMLDALDATEAMVRNNPWATCFRAYLHVQLLEPAEATRQYEQVRSFLQEKSAIEESDGFGLFDSIQDDYVAALLVQNRPLDVLRQWPENAGLYFQVGEYLVKLKDAKMTEQFLAFLPAKTDAASYQQTQRERLLAISAVEAKDMATGHQHHIRSVELAQAVEDLEAWSPYSQRSLIKEYADSLVRKSVTAVPPNYDDPYLQQQFLQSAMEQAANQGNHDLLDHYTAELQRVSDPAEDSIAGSYATNLEFLHAKGNHAEAEALSEKILDEYDPEDYNFQLAMQAAADYYLETEEFGDAIRCLKKTDPSVDPHVTVAFARADGVALEKHFASTNRDTVWEWFSDHAHWLRPHSQTHWFGELQDRYRLPLTINYAQEDLTLLFPADTDISADQILVALQSSVQASSAGNLEFTKIRTARPGCESWSFVPTYENWQLIVTLETGRVQLDNGPLDVQKQIAEPVTRLSLQWFGSRNSFKLSKTAFEVTVTLATQGAFALAHEGRDYHAYVWDLKTATPLTWDNRFSKPYSVSYLETIPDPTSKEIPFTRWNRMFRASDGTLPVEVIVMNNYGNEVVPGVVVDTLPEQEMLVVRMEADSVVDSLVVRGREYSVENYELRLPEPPSPAKAEQ